MKKNTVEAEIASYTGKILRDNFGKGPSSVYVSIEEPLITIYLKDFLAPIEKVLQNRRNELKVEETRDLMMKELIPDLKAALKSMAGIEIDGIHYDWNLGKRTGLIFVAFNTSNPLPEKEYPGKKAIEEEINRLSIKAQKMPEETTSSMLNSRTLAVIRKGILVDIEKELIANEFTEELKLSKRKLEKRFFNNDHLKSLIDGEMEDIFVGWDFELDIGYSIFIIKPSRTV